MHMLFRFRVYGALALTLALLCGFPAPSIHAASKHIPCCGAISPAGMRLASVLDGMNVESLWLAREHVNWDTGEPDRGGDDEGLGNHTHCSAFVASAAQRGEEEIRLGRMLYPSTSSKLQLRLQGIQPGCETLSASRVNTEEA